MQSLKALLGTGTVRANVFWSCVHRGFYFINNIVIGALVARHLGAEDYGVLVGAFALVTVFTPLCNFSIPVFLIRECSSNKERAGVFIASGSIVQLLACLIVWPLLLYVMYQNNFGSAYILASIAIFQVPLKSAEAFESSQLNFRRYAILDVSFLLILAGLRYQGAFTGKSLDYFVLLLLLQYFVPNLSLVVLQLWKRSYVPGIKGFSEFVSRNYKDAFFLSFTALVSALFMNLDIMMLSWVSNDAEVGLYGVGSRLSMALYFLPLILGRSFMVRLSAAANDSQKLSQIRKKYFMFNTLVGMLVCVLALIFFPFIIRWFYGEEYFQSVSVFCIHIFSLFFVFWGVARQQFLVLSSNTIYGLLLSILGLALNASLNLYFIPDYGSVGAAYTTLFTQVAIALIFPVLFADTRQILLWQISDLFVHAK